MAIKHYVRIKFPVTKDNTPGIYDFLWKHMGNAMYDAGIKKVKVDIKRLEPIDSIYTNLEIEPEAAEAVLKEFAKAHHLKKHKSLTALKHLSSLRCDCWVKDIGKILDDYNLLFDIFFTDITIKSDKLTIDMMDGFSNSVLAIAEEKQLAEFQKTLRKKMQGIKFEFVDPPKK